jgi:hypothetical protein
MSCIQRQQIEIIVRPAMQHTAAAIDGRIDQGRFCPAIFGLHVVNRVAQLDVGVMAEEHLSGYPSHCNSLILSRAHAKISLT